MQLTGDKPQPSDPSEADVPHQGGHSADAETPRMNPWEDGFCTELEQYSGPLELLLYLIHRNEIDILDIPVAQVLEQFLAHVTAAQQASTLDLGQAGDYLVMGARLFEIKCRMLSPDLIEAEDDLLEEELEDPRQSLVEQLLDYRDFKERAQLLEEAHRRRSLGYERVQGEMPPPPPGTLDLSETSSLDLASAFQRVLDLLTERSSFTLVHAEEIPIEQAMTEVMARLRGAPGDVLPFEELFPLERGIPGVVSTFLAILELTRLLQLRIEQDSIKDPLLVRLREDN